MLPLEILHLFKNYGPLTAVRDVSFSIKEGEVFGLLGPNGAGKTSIISILVTLQQPTSGSVRVYGNEISLHGRTAKTQMGYVPQELVNHGYFSVQEILEFHSGYFGIWNNKKRIDQLLERLDLAEHRHKRVKQLSGGMKRRLLIAKALVHDPSLILLDEPTAGVDIDLRRTLLDFVEDLRNEGKAILLTTHYIEEAERLCDRIGILQKGELKRVGETRSLIKNFALRRVKLDVDPGQAPVKHRYLVEQSATHIVFEVPGAQALGPILREAGIREALIRDFRVEEGKLEDVMRYVLGEP